MHAHIDFDRNIALPLVPWVRMLAIDRNSNYCAYPGMLGAMHSGSRSGAGLQYQTVLHHHRTPTPLYCSGASLGQTQATLSMPPAAYQHAHQLAVQFGQT